MEGGRTGTGDCCFGHRLIRFRRARGPGHFVSRALLLGGGVIDELREVFFALMMLFELEPTRVGDAWQVSSEVDQIHDTRSAFAMRLELPGPWQEDRRERLLVCP